MKRIKFWLYVLVGVIAAIAGLIRTSMMGQMHPTNLLGMEMMVIAAVVLGGARITGGTGTVTGTLLGVLLVVVINNSLIMAGVPSTWQRVVVGSLILLAGAFFVVRRRR